MLTFILSPIGRAGLVVAGVLAFLGLFALDQQHRGAFKAVAKIDKANTHAVLSAHSARDRSRNGTGGVLDPNTIAEDLSP